MNENEARARLWHALFPTTPNPPSGDHLSWVNLVATVERLIREVHEGREGLAELLGLANGHSNWEQILREVRINRDRAAGLPDDLRNRGWAVAVHNDYFQPIRPGSPKVQHTYWLLTHAATGRFVKGEGLSDQEALDEIRTKLRELVG